MTDAPKQARRAEYMVHAVQSEMLALLEETGGEFTAEVQALEDRLAKNVNELAHLGATMKLHAKAQRQVAKDEIARLKGIVEFYDRLEGAAERWCRIAAHEMGVTKYEAGPHIVSLRKKPARLVGGPDVGSDGWATSEEAGVLVRLGLGVAGIRPDRRAILAELKSGGDVLNYAVDEPTEKSVVVK